MKDIDQAHRPWPVPIGPWTLHMEWSDLCFFHWAVDASVLRPLIPRELEIDLWDSRAWVGVVPFTMSNVYFRRVTRIPVGASFLELNVRTYVVKDGKPGVWFFSLDATSALTILGARVTFGLPYYFASMSSTQAKNDSIHYRSKRRFSSADCEFRGSYWPNSVVRKASVNSQERWLTERYCLYSKLLGGRLARAEIHHAPWPLQDALCTIETNSMHRTVAGLSDFTEPPIVHFAKHLEVVGWPPDLVT